MALSKLRQLFAATATASKTRRAPAGRMSVETLEGRAMMAAHAFAGIHAAAIVAKAAPTISQAENYVDAVFSTVLFRSPTADELTRFSVPLANGRTSYSQVASALLNSRENLTNIVDQDYLTVLNRLPNASESNNGIAMLSKKNGSENQLLARLFATREYQNLTGYRGASGFVSSVAGTYGVTFPDSALAANSSRIVKKGLYQGALTVLGSNQVRQQMLMNTYNSIITTSSPTSANLASLARSSGSRFGGRISLLSGSEFVNSVI
jgi:hypothetical protein